MQMKLQGLVETNHLTLFLLACPIWHRLAKLSILILEGSSKKFPMSVATMSR